MTDSANLGAMTWTLDVPRSNGELVFDEPWQARVFGLAVGLIQECELDWEEFRVRLVDEISRWEHEDVDTPRATYDYYERWLAALERLAVDLNLVSQSELENSIRATSASDGHEHPDEHVAG